MQVCMTNNLTSFNGRTFILGMNKTPVLNEVLPELNSKLENKSYNVFIRRCENAKIYCRYYPRNNQVFEAFAMTDKSYLKGKKPLVSGIRVVAIESAKKYRRACNEIIREMDKEIEKNLIKQNNSLQTKLTNFIKKLFKKI